MQHQRRHQLVAHPRVRHGVHRDPADVGVPQQDPLHGGGGEVLAVHPQPVTGAAGVVGEAVGVEVGQVAAPVHPVAHPLGGGRLVVVVAGELPRAGRVHQLADRRVEVEHLAVRAELGRWALRAGVGVQHLHTVERPAQGAGGSALDPGDDDGVLRRAEAVVDPAAEALRERRDVLLVGLVAERQAQRVVGVVRPLRRGQDVGQRLADVVDVRRPEVPHVVEEPARREPLAERERGAGGQCEAVARHHGVGVEQRHRDVADVVGGDPEHVGEHESREPHLLVGHPHRLRLAARPRGEDQHEQRGRRSTGGACSSGTLRASRDQRRPCLRVDEHDGHVDALQQPRVRSIGEHQLAVAGADVGEQGVPAPRGVEPDDDVATEGRGRQGHHHLGGVVEEHADVRWAPGVEHAAQRGGPRGGLGHVLGPGPGARRLSEPRAVVAGPVQQELAQRRHRVRRARRPGSGRRAGPARWRRRTGTRSASRR